MCCLIHFIAHAWVYLPPLTERLDKGLCGSFSSTFNGRWVHVCSVVLEPTSFAIWNVCALKGESIVQEKSSVPMTKSGSCLSIFVIDLHLHIRANYVFFVSFFLMIALPNHQYYSQGSHFFIPSNSLIFPWLFPDFLRVFPDFFLVFTKTF